MKGLHKPCVLVAAVFFVGTLVGLSRAAGVEQGGLQFTVSIDKPQYTSGEPVIVQFLWKNKSDRDMYLREWAGPNAGVARVVTDEDDILYDFAIYRETGERLRYNGGSVDGLPGQMHLEPGQVESRSYDVSRSYDLTQPGKYILRAAYVRAVKPGRPPAPDYLVHPDLTIIIVDAK